MLSRKLFHKRNWGFYMESQIRLELYQQMVLIRSFEEAILKNYHADKKPIWDIGAGLIPGEMHLSAGQEPIAAGICAHLGANDAITAAHRPHHLAISHGMDLKSLTAEIFGRQDGLGHGRGGHMHLFDPSIHFSCYGIIAEGFPPALGQAFVFKNKGSDAVVVAVAGEGAANQGAFHESLNLASLWKLPVVFVIEDNDWAISVPKDASTSVVSNATRAAAYSMPGQRVEDNSVEAIYEAAGSAIQRARSGQGPTLLEIHTLRLWGHFEGDAQGYRPDLETASSRDPIPAYEQQLKQDQVLDNQVIQQIKQQANERVNSAIEYAKASPIPDPTSALEYVFS